MYFSREKQDTNFETNVFCTLFWRFHVFFTLADTVEILQTNVKNTWKTLQQCKKYSIFVVQNSLRMKQRKDQITINIPAPVCEALRNAADNSGKSMSSYAAEAIAATLQGEFPFRHKLAAYSALGELLEQVGNPMFDQAAMAECQMQIERLESALGRLLAAHTAQNALGAQVVGDDTETPLGEEGEGWYGN